MVHSFVNESYGESPPKRISPRPEKCKPAIDLAGPAISDSSLISRLTGPMPHMIYFLLITPEKRIDKYIFIRGGS